MANIPLNMLIHLGVHALGDHDKDLSLCGFVFGGFAMPSLSAPVPAEAGLQTHKPHHTCSGNDQMRGDATSLMTVNVTYT